MTQSVGTGIPTRSVGTRAPVRIAPLRSVVAQFVGVPASSRRGCSGSRSGGRGFGIRDFQVRTFERFSGNSRLLMRTFGWLPGGRGRKMTQSVGTRIPTRSVGTRAPFRNAPHRSVVAEFAGEPAFSRRGSSGSRSGGRGFGIRDFQVRTFERFSGNSRLLMRTFGWLPGGRGRKTTQSVGTGIRAGE